MSGTTETQRQTSSSQSIPSRRVLLNDPSQLPHDYSTTPGGTLFSTTPGGTRIIYDRAFLIQCRNSPLTKSPPANLPKIAGVTSPRDGHDMATIQENGHAAAGDREAGVKPAARHVAQPGVSAEEQQFEMDI